MVTVEESEELWEIDQAIVDKLKNDGITGYFKVQLKVIPLLLRFNSQNSVQPRDMCISAPTGSGKTLAYVIPIINLLKNKFTSRLRALVILPGRELAIQVHKVFKNLTNHTSISTLCTVGQSNFIEEQCILMGTNITNDTSIFFSNNQLYKNESTECVIDIMISTPGRLMEHLNNTKGFNLHHLRYLVLDEADRLLGNAYSFWVKSLVESTYISTNSLNSYEIDKLVSIHHPLQRLLFSATLSDNPKKLALLGIRNPLLIQVGSEGDIELSDENIKNPLETFKYELPSTLSESIKICTTTDRPKHLIAVLAEEFNIFSTESTEESNKLCIIFSSSIETTHRLCLLLQLYNGQDISTDSDLPDDDLTRYLFKGKIAEISSLMKASEKEKTIQEALNNKIKILVASDQLSRGIDLPNVKLVINYDPPKYSRTYIHRVGRTARANRFGHCITFLRKRQLDSFFKLRESIGKESNSMNKIPKRKVPKSLTDMITPLYLTALSNLQIHLNK